MVGGADTDVARALPLRACGTPVHLGPLGAGQVAKACNQMIVASTILASVRLPCSPTAAG
jgi:2-hydroxy-3-oxopropionate reductase